jgi:hypothetical protein
VTGPGAQPGEPGEPNQDVNSLVVTSRPIRSSQLSYAAAIVIVIVFGVTALVMPHANAGAHFFWKDQLGTFVIGLVLAGLALLPTRPRLRADVNGIQARAYLGAPRTIPWDVVTAIEFPKKLRFARVVLPGEETLALYAVQRFDRDHSIEVMQGLRALLRAAHPVAGLRRDDGVGPTR